ncbi:placenta growth factor-like [Ambystoma mexicanum]|uniref:placenta growth factor-like n=1 Tax=Ambystoma mexicanum TaxID=8296 RepID=UPI0037E70A5E
MAPRSWRASRGMAVTVGLRILLLSPVLLRAVLSQVPISQNRTPGVVLFEDVWKGSYCRTIDTLVDILSEYPHEAAHIFKPSCVLLRRCGGCCGDETLECVPLETRAVTMQVIRVSPIEENTVPEEMTFTEHSICECRRRRKRQKHGNKSTRRQRPKGKAPEAPVTSPAMLSSPHQARSRSPRQRGSECKSAGHRCKKNRKKGKKKERRLHKTEGRTEHHSPDVRQPETVTGL